MKREWAEELIELLESAPKGVGAGVKVPTQSGYIRIMYTPEGFKIYDSRKDGQMQRISRECAIDILTRDGVLAVSPLRYSREFIGIDFTLYVGD